MYIYSFKKMAHGTGDCFKSTISEKRVKYFFKLCVNFIYHSYWCHDGHHPGKSNGCGIECKGKFNQFTKYLIYKLYNLQIPLHLKFWPKATPTYPKARDAYAKSLVFMDSQVGRVGKKIAEEMQFSLTETVLGSAWETSKANMMMIFISLLLCKWSNRRWLKFSFPTKKITRNDGNGDEFQCRRFWIINKKLMRFIIAWFTYILILKNSIQLVTFIKCLLLQFFRLM